MGNREIREKTILKKREEHLSKIARIMTREPSIRPALEGGSQRNPRKRAVKPMKDAMTERENKALLKRISDILTAPPKITDADYLKMKALVSSVRGFGPKQRFEKKLDEKRMKTFFNNLSRTGPYYNTKQWEHDYQIQVRVISAEYCLKVDC